MLKRVSNKDLLKLVDKVTYDDGGKAKKVFSPEEAHEDLTRSMDIIATYLQKAGDNQEIIDTHNSMRVSVDNLFSNMMSKFSEVIMEMKNNQPILERINVYQNTLMSKMSSSEEWEFDANRDSTGKIIFPIKARKL